MTEISLSSLPVATSAEAVARARRDYLGVVGQTVYPRWLFGYQGDSNVVSELDVGFKVGVRVRQTSDQDIARFCDEFCDPYWDVEVVDDPHGLAPNLRTAWIDGISYETPRGS